MQSKVAPFAATPDPTFARKSRSRSAQVSGGERRGETQEEADLRLVIEEDPVSGAYVYKTVDSVTGRVVQQIPRDEVLRMGEDETYVAGEVIRTKA